MIFNVPKRIFGCRSDSGQRRRLHEHHFRRLHQRGLHGTNLIFLLKKSKSVRNRWFLLNLIFPKVRRGGGGKKELEFDAVKMHVNKMDIRYVF